MRSSRSGSPLLSVRDRPAGHRSRSASVHHPGGAGCGSSAGLVCECPCTGGGASFTCAWPAVTASFVTLKMVRSWGRRHQPAVACVDLAENGVDAGGQVHVPQLDQQRPRRLTAPHPRIATAQHADPDLRPRQVLGTWHIHRRQVKRVLASHRRPGHRFRAAQKGRQGQPTRRIRHEAPRQLITDHKRTRAPAVSCLTTSTPITTVPRDGGN